MGIRELKIINDARITLNDVNPKTRRWTDLRLMSLLNDGQNEMCRQIPLIARKANIQTSSGMEEYSLPQDAVKLITASSNGMALTITSYDEIERDRPGWEEDKGSSYSALIVNALSQKIFRPYPLLSDDSMSQPIKIRYSAMPVQLGYVPPLTDNLIGDSLEELSIDSMWDFGLKQYVISMAFIDYGDESSLSRSQVALGLYNKELARGIKLSRKSFSKRSITTGYQGRVSNTRR